METFTTYVVQFWVDGYEYWSNCATPSESMFGLPTVDYDSEDEARAKFDAMREQYPSAKYRLIRRTVTQEVI